MDKSPKHTPKHPFSGYPCPTANTLYCPNQFFDVVLKHRSRSVVRITSFILRQTLGWSKPDGSPQQTAITVTYSSLINSAGVSRGSIKDALLEAERANFITRLKPPKNGPKNASATFEINWAPEHFPYSKDPLTFPGFFSGTGNRTYIPNAFFDHTARHEPLAVTKVVGAIIRHTIGFQNKYGFRRQHTELSTREIARITNLSTQKTHTAIHTALAHNHITRLKTASFTPGTPNPGSTYGVQWTPDSSEAPASLASENMGIDETSAFASAGCANDKTPASMEVEGLENALNNLKIAEICQSAILPSAKRRGNEEATALSEHIAPPQVAVQKGVPGEAGQDEVAVQKGQPEVVQKGEPKGSKKVNSTGSKRTTASVQKSVHNKITINNNLNNTTNKPLVAALLKIGFSTQAATQIVAKHPNEIIKKQLTYLPQRLNGKTVKNKLGLLRTSITQNWQAPPAGESTRRARGQGRSGDTGERERLRPERRLILRK